MATGNAPRGFPRILQWLLAGLMLIIGLAVGILGAKLALVGGTLYFALMGVVMVIAAVLIFRNRRGGILLYAVAFIASVIWAISDAGWNYWPLFSRLFALGVLAFLAALVWPFLASPPAKKGPAYGVAAVLAVALAVSFGWMFKSAPLVSATEAVPVKPVAPGEQQKNWAHWGNTTHGDRFAALDQINKQNVNQLQVAWVAHTGDIPQSNGSGAEDQNTPLQIGDTLYVCTPYSKVLALDVDSGKEKWRYDSKSSSPNWQRCRGLGYYADSQAQTAPASGTQPAACSRRLFLPTIDARLIAIDADTGKLCENFGDGGIVDLSVGMGEVKAGYYQQTSTPLVAGNVVVVGGGNVAMDAARCAKRLGAEQVYIVYRRGMAELPARKEEVEHAEEEGIIFKTLCNPVEIHANDEGFVKSITCIEMELGEPDASGRRRPIEKKGSEFELDVDTVIMSLGTSPNPLIRSTTPGLDADKHGCLITNGPDGLTSRPMVYAGGDAVTGPATVIRAVAAGKVAAANIDAHLGFRHVIKSDVEIPAPHLTNMPACGRIELRSRPAEECVGNFDLVKCGMTEQEVHQETSRCLRCDHFGYGIFKGGRSSKW